MDESELFSEVLELTLACQREDATAEQRARLERLLADNPRAIWWYVRIVDDTLTLRDAAAAIETASAAEPELCSLAAEEPPAPSKHYAMFWNDRWNRRRMSWGIAAAFTLLLAAYLALRPQTLVMDSNPYAAQPVAVETARIVDIANVTWADGAQQFREWSVVKPGDTLKFTGGWINLFLDNGAELLIEGPADVDFVSSKKVFARQGKLAARVGPEAIGFRIDTPHAKVTDRGTSFGVSVDGDSHTSVVVYEGIVDLDVTREGGESRRRLNQGEALSVDQKGQLSRITTVESIEFLEPPRARIEGSQPNRIIASVSDNVRSLETAKYYRIIPGGFREDCRAYVDRLHEWNGVDVRGLPPFLLGGDYVMTFNDDKIVSEIEVAVTTSQPANLYVLLDDRVQPPDWLKRDFVNTNWKVGGDDGWATGPFEEDGIVVDVGPGQSVEQTFSVWKRVLQAPTTTVLGSLTFESPPPDVKVGRSMYGIVVTPLEATRNNQSKNQRDFQSLLDPDRAVLGESLHVEESSLESETSLSAESSFE